MTFDDVSAHYKHDHTIFIARTGFSRRTWDKWKADGVPMVSQVKLQRLTGGRLKADPDHAPAKGE